VENGGLVGFKEKFLGVVSRVEDKG